jgi:hypothetical protein
MLGLPARDYEEFLEIFPTEALDVWLEVSADH